jgi:hypothetical protein
VDVPQREPNLATDVNTAAAFAMEEDHNSAPEAAGLTETKPDGNLPLLELELEQSLEQPSPVHSELSLEPLLEVSAATSLVEKSQSDRKLPEELSLEEPSEVFLDPSVSSAEQ